MAGPGQRRDAQRQEAAETAARARIHRDLAALNPAARDRYRAALRRLMRPGSAPGASAPAPARAPRPGAAVFLLGMVAAGAATLASVEPLAGAVAAAAVLAILLPALRRPRPEPDDGPEPNLAPLPAERAMALHVAALAASRRAYYLDEPAAGQGGLTRKV